MSLADASAASAPAAASRIVWVHPPQGFLGLSLLNGLLRILTLGVYHFWGKTEVRQRIWSAGDKAFAFTGRAGPLYRRFWLVWVSAIILGLAALGAIGGVVGQVLSFPGAGTRGMGPISREKIAAIVLIVFAALLVFAMIRAWYSSRMFNYFASETTYQGCRFHLATTVPSLVWLVASNYLIRTLSLTVLSPIAEARATRYIIDRLTLDGPIEWQAIGQNPDALLTSGEGLAEAFNVDGF